VRARDALELKYQSTVSQYLNGDIPLNTDMVLKFAKLLGCDPSEIDPELRKLTAKPVGTTRMARFLGVMRLGNSGEYELYKEETMPNTIATPLTAALPDGAEHLAIDLQHDGFRAIGLHARSTVYIATNLEPRQADAVYIDLGQSQAFYRYVTYDNEHRLLHVRDALDDMRSKEIRIDDVVQFGIVIAIVPYSYEDRRVWPALTNK